MRYSLCSYPIYVLACPCQSGRHPSVICMVPKRDRYAVERNASNDPTTASSFLSFKSRLLGVLNYKTRYAILRVRPRTIGVKCRLFWHDGGFARACPRSWYCTRPLCYFWDQINTGYHRYIIFGHIGACISELTPNVIIFRVLMSSSSHVPTYSDAQRLCLVNAV